MSRKRKWSTSGYKRDSNNDSLQAERDLNEFEDILKKLKTQKHEVGDYTCDKHMFRKDSTTLTFICEKCGMEHVCSDKCLNMVTEYEQVCSETGVASTVFSLKHTLTLSKDPRSGMYNNDHYTHTKKRPKNSKEEEFIASFNKVLHKLVSESKRKVLSIFAQHVLNFFEEFLHKKYKKTWNESVVCSTLHAMDVCSKRMNLDIEREPLFNDIMKLGQSRNLLHMLHSLENTAANRYRRDNKPIKEFELYCNGKKYNAFTDVTWFNKSLLKK